MSLRLRLVLGLVAVVLAGLGAVGLTTHAALRTFLTDRVDEQLRSVLDIAVNQLGPAARPPVTAPPVVPVRGDPRLPTGTYAEVRRPDGTVLASRTLTSPFADDGSGNDDRAALPDDVVALALGSTPQDPAFLTAGAVDGSGRFRLLAVPAPGNAANIIVVGLPLDELDRTLDRLDVILVGVSAAVLLLVVAGAWFLVGLGLRPLARIGRTAGDIAGGDLTRRVAPDDERTEIGQLGHALNTMLGQIEEGFAERAGSSPTRRTSCGPP